MTRTLSPQELTVSALGPGCMGMSQGYGPADDAESIATIDRAIELGVTFLDCYVHPVDPDVPVEETVGATGELVARARSVTSDSRRPAPSSSSAPPRRIPSARSRPSGRCGGARSRTSCRPRRLEESAAVGSIALPRGELDQLEALASRTAWSGDRQSLATRTTATAA